MLDRLPYDITRSIVQLANADHVYFPSLQTRVTLPSVAASHVCRSLRNALLSDPTMWTRVIIRPNDKGQTKELLRRSGSASLDVFVDTLNWPLDAHALAIALQEMHRIRTLQITVFARNDAMKHLVYQMLPYLQHPAPRLSSLSIAIEWNNSLVNEQFPQILFAGHTPNLKHISLKTSPGFHKFFSPSLFRNLSTINLEMADSTLIKGDRFLDVLELSPHLRDISISSDNPEQTFSSPKFAGRRVHLSHLQQLVLGGNSGVGITDFVLRHLDFPSENIRFRIRCVDFQDEQSGSVSDPLPRFLAQRRFTSLSIDSFDPELMNLTFNDPPNFESVFETKYHAMYELALDLPSFIGRNGLSYITHLVLDKTALHTTSFEKIFALLMNLQHFRIDYDGPTAGDSQAESFVMALTPRVPYISSQTPSATELDIHNQIYSSNTVDFRVTTPEHNESQRDGPSTILCPSLHTLDITISSLYCEVTEMYVQSVVTCAELRRQAGHPFRDIIIRCFLLQQEAVSCLQRHKDFPITLLINREGLFFIRDLAVASS